MSYCHKPPLKGEVFLHVHRYCQMISTASPERGGGCAEGADGEVPPLVTMTDTEQQKKFTFDKYGT